MALFPGLTGWAGNHASTPPLSFLQAACPSCCQTNSVKALKDSLARNESNQAITAQDLAKILAEIFCGKDFYFPMTRKWMEF